MNNEIMNNEEIVENENNKKSLGYKMGQLICVVLSLCICALLIGITVGLMMRMF